MPFIRKRISEIASINLSDFESIEGLPRKEISPDWPCAEDEELHIVFMQIYTSARYMMDEIYHYLLIIEKDWMLMQWSAGKVTIFNKGSALKYTKEKIIELSDTAATICTVHKGGKKK